MKPIIVECDSSAATPNYVPPPIGNGDFSIQVDMEGVQNQQNYHSMTPGIYRAGRRYETKGWGLIPFGHFLQDTGTPKQWKQHLNVTEACISTECEYADGRKIQTDAFVHLNHPLLAIRKHVQGDYVFRYLLAREGEEKLPPMRMAFMPVKDRSGVNIYFKADGTEEFQGVISLWTDCSDAEISVIRNEVRIAVDATESATFFLTIHDSLDHEDPTTESCELRRMVSDKGHDGMFASHVDAWQDYWQECYVDLPNEREQTIYYTAQYHLRISSTRWSLPVGIFPSHWQARYFSFDDHFSFMGLVTSGHTEPARRIPEFRFNTLQQAKDRAHAYFSENLGGARWLWELLEDGETEGAPKGFWLEHIFHMANIALSAWYYALYSGDDAFLSEKAFPVIKGCAEFYETQSVYKVGDDRYIVGKCTDLERLGPARENAYMTTCGVIATFRVAAEAAEALDVDADRAATWRFLADRLLETLPSEDGRYVPFPGCTQKSIAVFAGTFPYHILPADDSRQRAAIDDFLENEDQYGNMYPIGNSVCTWYAAMKGIVFARIGDLAGAKSCIAQCVKEAGYNCFSEIFEISQPAKHPWFTTAEGSYVHLINESLMQSKVGEIRLIDFGREHYSFKLPAVGGVTVEAEFRDSAVGRLSIHASVPYHGRLHLPSGQSYEISLAEGESWYHS